MSEFADRYQTEKQGKRTVLLFDLEPIAITYDGSVLVFVPENVGAAETDIVLDLPLPKVILTRQAAYHGAEIEKFCIAQGKEGAKRVPPASFGTMVQEVPSAAELFVIYNEALTKVRNEPMFWSDERKDWVGVEEVSYFSELMIDNGYLLPEGGRWMNVLHKAKPELP